RKLFASLYFLKIFPLSFCNHCSGLFGIVKNIVENNISPFAKTTCRAKGSFLMGKIKIIYDDVEPTRDLLFLLMIGGLYSLSVALSNTFVNIYLWKQSGKFADLGMYNLAVVVFQPLTFILAGKWAKNIDRVIVLRLGVIFLSLF